MAETSRLRDAFLGELRETYDAERQLTKALSSLAKASSSPKLREAFESHLEETQGQIERLEQVFESFDEKARGKHCDGIAGRIEEGKSIKEEDFDATTLDACLIAAGQRAEHYEMAAYGTLIAWAEAMGQGEAVKLLQKTLDEKKAADRKLSSLAEVGINETKTDLGGDGGIRVRESVRLEVPVEHVYRYWRRLENLPRFMTHLNRVTQTPDGKSHWIAAGPAGPAVEWHADVINEIENKVLAWRSVPGSDVDTAGSVNFRGLPGGRSTQVTVNLQYAPPPGKAGALVASLFDREPSQIVREDLRQFKELLEGSCMKVVIRRPDPTGV
jgi:ferritin-like metal-binding protein YciE/uncharacterized protein YndB with AHSA1/START domain